MDVHVSSYVQKKKRRREQFFHSVYTEHNQAQGNIKQAMLKKNHGSFLFQNLAHVALNTQTEKNATGFTTRMADNKERMCDIDIEIEREREREKL